MFLETKSSFFGDTFFLETFSDFYFESDVFARSSHIHTARLQNSNEFSCLFWLGILSPITCFDGGNWTEAWEANYLSFCHSLLEAVSLSSSAHEQPGFSRTLQPSSGIPQLLEPNSLFRCLEPWQRWYWHKVITPTISENIGYGHWSWAYACTRQRQWQRTWPSRVFFSFKPCFFQK